MNGPSRRKVTDVWPDIGAALLAIYALFLSTMISTRVDKPEPGTQTAYTLCAHLVSEKPLEQTYVRIRVYPVATVPFLRWPS